MRFRLILGDALDQLTALGSGSVQCCVTSPPYFNLRDYGVLGQIGLEDSPEAFVARLVDVFREVKRVLKDDGTLWLNIGDSYAGAGGGVQGVSGGGSTRTFQMRQLGAKMGAKPKDLLGIPWLLAFALRADGWFLRSDIIWYKPNAMPESVTDRPTSAHEHVFLLSKRDRYFYDADAIAEPALWERWGDQTEKNAPPGKGGHLGGKLRSELPVKDTKNARNVWSISTQPYSGAHFAVMPLDLARKCVLAGSRENDTILDPFSGAGTTGLAALSVFRRYVGIELNPEFLELSRARLIPASDEPLF